MCIIITHARSQSEPTGPATNTNVANEMVKEETMKHQPTEPATGTNVAYGIMKEIENSYDYL